MSAPVRIWYVSAQRLCNFRCAYCVSVGDYSKSNKLDWAKSTDHAEFDAIVHWIGSRPFPVEVRLATLGEPFASRDFLAGASWLTQQEHVGFVELLTNGSLLKRRLPALAETADMTKISLWITHHHTEIEIGRFIDNARFAQDEYGCFVVVNALLFPGNQREVADLRMATERAGLRFHVDVGYDPAQNGATGSPSQSVPILQEPGGADAVVEMGVDPEMLRLNLTALDDPRDRACSAGHDYIYIGIDGDVYPCSRYYVLKNNRLGNVLDPEFELALRPSRWTRCQALAGCCNKEDFLNLAVSHSVGERRDPSLGWTSR
ncbi:SPASM domain-containing protein [Nocardia abscessus]|uniref:SPASM domain-containing protein n=1 Tax=Nocardia abscessus TaxID=120957 RepID=UPI002454D399|nr:SPASM domain-containing protein [Nocardia abscessus]